MKKIIFSALTFLSITASIAQTTFYRASGLAIQLSKNTVEGNKEIAYIDQGVTLDFKSDGSICRLKVNDLAFDCVIGFDRTMTYSAKLESEASISSIYDMFRETKSDLPAINTLSNFEKFPFSILVSQPQAISPYATVTSSNYTVATLSSDDAIYRITLLNNIDKLKRESAKDIEELKRAARNSKFTFY